MIYSLTNRPKQSIAFSLLVISHVLLSIVELRSQDLESLTPALGDGGKWGYRALLSEKLSIPARYDLAQRFSHNLAAVKIGHSWGYIDKSGELVIEPKYISARPFVYGTATVQFKKDQWGVIQVDGTPLFETHSQGLGPMTRDNLAWQKIGDRYGYVKKDGKLAIEPIFEWAGDFSEGIAPVRMEGKVGYIDKLGKYLIEPKYITGSTFSNEIALIEMQEGFTYIDKKGQTVFDLFYKRAQSFQGQFALAMKVDNKKYGMIDVKGTFHSEHQEFDDLYRLNNTTWIGRNDNRCFSVSLNAKGPLVKAIATSYVSVKLCSKPSASKVFAIPFYEFDGADLDQLLGDSRYRVPEGDTDTSTGLDKFTEYRIVFINAGRREIRVCTPTVNTEINVSF